MATGAGASSSQLRDTSPTRQRTYPMPMSVQHMRVSNKATALRELHRSQRMHMEKLRNMKPGIDMKRPEQPKFLQYNAKRVQMEKERNLTIERENKILLGKMYSIMNAEPAYKTHKARPTQTMFTSCVCTLNVRSALQPPVLTLAGDGHLAEYERAQAGVRPDRP